MLYRWSSRALLGIVWLSCIIFGLYMTWGVGANDVANAMGTSVGSGAITVRKAIHERPWQPNVLKPPSLTPNLNVKDYQTDAVFGRVLTDY